MKRNLFLILLDIGIARRATMPFATFPTLLNRHLSKEPMLNHNTERQVTKGEYFRHLPIWQRHSPGKWLSAFRSLP